MGLPGISVGELVARLGSDGAPPPAFSRVLDDYIETQTHDPVDLASDAEQLLLDPSYRDTPTGETLLQAADRHQLEVSWHAGSELTMETFPATIPAPEGDEQLRWQRFLLSGRAAGLAARVISDHSADGERLTAASIGAAACAFVREPARWRQWGAPDPSLTVLKDLWRILIAHGAPHTPRDRG